MAYSEHQIKILQEYHILKSDGTPTMVDLRLPVTNRLGLGPLMAKDAVDRLIAADTTPDQHWLDWIFFQAAGGEPAKANIEKAIQEIHKQYVENRVIGLRQNGVRQEPIPEDVAEEKWLKHEPRYRQLFVVCDQDAVERLHTFGYFRNWPGYNNIYASVVDAVTHFLKIAHRIPKMAKKERVSLDPSSYADCKALKDTAQKVERYFAAKIARSDIRLANDNKPIYEDDIVEVLVPLTYAAAVKYGYDLWPWANEKQFDDTLTDPKKGIANPWKTQTSQDRIVVYFKFKVPVPVWVSDYGMGSRVSDFTDLATVLNTGASQQNSDKWIVHDQENRNTLTLADVKQQIMDEPTRINYNDEDNAIKRGANVILHQDPVIKNEEEPGIKSKEKPGNKSAEKPGNKSIHTTAASQIVASIDLAVKAVKNWITTFDTKSIRSDVFTLD